MEMGYIKKKPGRDAIDWTLLEEVIAENPDLYGQLKYKSRPEMASVTQAAGPSRASGSTLPWPVGPLRSWRWRRRCCGARPRSACLPASGSCWALGLADPKLLPPPHIFLGIIADQAKFFNTVNRWQVGAGQGGGTTPLLAVFYTIWPRQARVRRPGDRLGAGGLDRCRHPLFRAVRPA